MKALLRKDLYVMWGQLKLYLLIILVFAALPVSFNNVFGIFYAYMMPYSSIAYDERSRWDQLAVMLPYSIRELVLSKYVLGWLTIGGTAAATLVIQGGLSLVLPSASFQPMLILLAICAAASMMAATLPLVFRFGVEKGRLFTILLIVVACVGASALSGLPVTAADAALLVSALAITLVLTVLSIPLSIRYYTWER